MYFLFTAAEMCTTKALNPIWSIAGFVVKAIWIGVPILLIVFGMIDLGKAVIASKEDEIKKATKAFGKRFLYAALVFAVVWIVTVVLNLVSGLGLTDGANGTVNTNGWENCWCKIAKGVDNCTNTD